MLPANMDTIQQPDISCETYQEFQAKHQVSEALNEHIFLELTTLEKVLKEAEKLIEHIQETYTKLRLDEAFRKVVILEGLGNNLSSEEKERFEDFLKQNEALLKNIKEDHEYMEHNLVELTVDEGWNVEKSGNLKVWYKKAENTNSVSLRLEAELDIPLINMITLIYEVDLWPLWIPFVSKTQEIKAIHKGAKIYYLEASLPYPLANRQMHVYGVGLNRLYENGTVLVMAKSIDDNKEFFERHDAKKIEKPKDVNIEIKMGGFELKPLGPNKIKFVGVANINPNFTWLPDSILNFIVRKGSGLVFNFIIKHAKNFKGSAWEKETQKPEKKEFYDWLNQEVNEYFAREASKNNNESEKEEKEI